jgi:hypothetical protein
VVICRHEDLIALASSIARSYPTYTRRSTIKKTKQLQIEFMVIDHTTTTPTSPQSSIKHIGIGLCKF